MPTPVYIVCSESGSIDSETQKVSIVNVVEKLQITKIEDLPKGEPGGVQRHVIATIPLRITLVWDEGRCG